MIHTAAAALIEGFLSVSDCYPDTTYAQEHDFIGFCLQVIWITNPDVILLLHEQKHRLSPTQRNLLHYLLEYRQVPSKYCFYSMSHKPASPLNSTNALHSGH